MRRVRIGSVVASHRSPDTDLKSRIVKVQTTLVAGPRNQPRRVVSTPTWYVLELHPRSLGAGVLVCEVDKGGKLTIKLHPELSIVRYEPDLFDELTNAFHGL